MSRPVEERMADAKNRMVNVRRRTPRAFYLVRKDYDEFAATNPPTVEATFALPLGSKPSPMTCLAFDGIAVRLTNRKPDRHGMFKSNLYSCCGVSCTVPVD